MPSAASERVADRNIALAVQAGKRSASRGPGSGGIEPFLVDVKYAPVTEATIAAGNERKAVEQRAMAVIVTGFVIGETGCGGVGCAAGHEAHVDAVRELLMALELIPKPEPQEET